MEKTQEETENIAVTGEENSQTDAAYTAEDIEAQIKPLSTHGFVRFFQRLWRRWLEVWYGFCDRKPKLSAIIYQIFFFLAFSIGVTVWQYVVMTFLPYAFAALNDGAAGWPNVPVGDTGQTYVIFGDTQGWGYFIAFEIAVFTAQCINFPLQRNVTYRSHGNPWYQAMWYFIGWVLVSVATNAVWGICNVYIVYWQVPDAVTGIIKTLLTSIVSLVVFFFVFMVIFPDNVKIARKARARYEKLLKSSAPAEKIAAAEAKMKIWEHRAALSEAEKEYVQAKSLAGNKAMRFKALNDAAKAREESAEEVTKAYEAAVEAIKVKERKEQAFNEVKTKIYD